MLINATELVWHCFYQIHSFIHSFIYCIKPALYRAHYVSQKSIRIGYNSNSNKEINIIEYVIREHTQNVTVMYN